MTTAREEYRMPGLDHGGVALIASSEEKLSFFGGLTAGLIGTAIEAGAISRARRELETTEAIRARTLWDATKGAIMLGAGSFLMHHAKRLAEQEQQTAHELHQARQRRTSS
jgi:hypothetical protein